MNIKKVSGSTDDSHIYLWQIIKPRVNQPPAPWCEENISFEDDVSAACENLSFEYGPYLRPVIAAWDFDGVKREITVVAPEQTGKTLAWMAPFIWSLEVKPCVSMIVYQSEDIAERINTIKLQPLMKPIPHLAVQLARRGTVRKDHYSFSGAKSYFNGAGARLTSVSAKICIADELDSWQDHEGRVANLVELRKRMRSYDESLLVKVCSPSGGLSGANVSKIWQEFLKSSMGYWHLTCQSCGKKTMRSCDIFNLQFETREEDGENILIPGSCRLVCPKCKHEHHENDKRKMNIEGGYLHERPELKHTNAGFQWGALATSVPGLCWDNIATAQLMASSRGDLEDQVYFDNSIRGMPFKPRRRDEAHLTSLKRHIVEAPDPETLTHRILSVDTQDDCFYYVVRGFLENGDNHLLECGQVMTLDDLLLIWDKKIFGDLCQVGIIDAGGHRADEVAGFVSDKPGMFAYKGWGSLTTRWKTAKDSMKMIIANPNPFKAELLHYLYSDQSYRNIWIPPDTPEVWFNHVLDMKPNSKKRSGNEYINWEGSGEDHLFDCEKMCLLAHEIYMQAIKKKKKKKPQAQRKSKVQIGGK